jgi:hypothetical protein
MEYSFVNKQNGGVRLDQVPLNEANLLGMSQIDQLTDRIVKAIIKFMLENDFSAIVRDRVNQLQYQQMAFTLDETSN